MCVKDLPCSFGKKAGSTGREHQLDTGRDGGSVCRSCGRVGGAVPRLRGWPSEPVLLGLRHGADVTLNPGQGLSGKAFWRNRQVLQLSAYV